MRTVMMMVHATLEYDQCLPFHEESVFPFQHVSWVDVAQDCPIDTQLTHCHNRPQLPYEPVHGVLGVDYEPSSLRHSVSNTPIFRFCARPR